jgi:hypothetical protein
MRKNSAVVILATGIAIAGCNRNHGSVFVDLDAILSAEPHRQVAETPIPKPPAPRPALTATVLGLQAKALEDPSIVQKVSIQEMFKTGQAAALGTLLARLRELNKEAVEEFRLQQQSSISDEEFKAFADADAKIRPLFEAWANKRAPIFANLAMIAGFPIPDAQPQPADKPITPLKQKQNQEADRLRSQLKDLDDKFKSDSAAILAGVAKQTHTSKEELALRIEQLANELDKKAEREANSQIRNAESKLSFQLADSAPIRLPETPARHLTIPGEKALDQAPKVPSSGILEGAADRRRLLDHELRIWLALNRYTLSETRAGHRDATQEFQIWRQLHGAGP